MHITIKQGIDNCYLAHIYEHPGYEDDRCAGLRTMSGEGEPIDECKECALYYGNMETEVTELRDIKTGREYRR